MTAQSDISVGNNLIADGLEINENRIGEEIFVTNILHIRKKAVTL